MRIAIIVESFPNLSETFVLNHIKGLIDAGVQVKIFSYARPGKGKIHRIFFEYKLQEITQYGPAKPAGLWSQALQLLKHSVVLFARSRKVFFNAVEQAYKKRAAYPFARAATYINRSTFDLVHCHFGTMANDLLLYGEPGFNNIPVITTFHGYDIDNTAIRNNARFYKDLIKKGALFIANSKYTKNRLIETGFPEEKITVIPVSLDTAKFSLNGKHEVADPGPAKKVIIITVGRLVDFKGHQYGIEAVSLLAKKGFANIEYRIVGDGPLKLELQEMTTRLQLDGIVRFCGSLSQEELITELTQADIFLLPGIKSDGGREENQGLVIQEAQAMNLPVIVSDVGGVKEGMMDGVTGCLVAQKDVNGIAGKLEILIKDPALRRNMGMEGRRFVEHNYSIEAATRRLLKLYEAVLSR